MHHLHPHARDNARKLTEAELLQADMKGFGWRLAAAVAAFALLILSLNAAYDEGSDLPGASTGPVRMSEAR